jgi:hypothetical protein
MLEEAADLTRSPRFRSARSGFRRVRHVRRAAGELSPPHGITQAAVKDGVRQLAGRHGQAGLLEVGVKAVQMATRERLQPHMADEGTMRSLMTEAYCVWLRGRSVLLTAGNHSRVRYSPSVTFEGCA